MHIISVLTKCLLPNSEWYFVCTTNAKPRNPDNIDFSVLHTENFNPEELHWGKSLTMIYQVLLKEEVIALKDELEKGLPGTAKVSFKCYRFERVVSE